MVMNQFKAQAHRGTEGFGVFDKECTRLVRATKQRKILGWLKHHPSKSLLFHHRFPTSTENVKNACHPFSTKDHFKTNYVLVHNGHISNASELKAEHEALGIEYYSVQKDGRFNDSEALLWDVALYLEGKQESLKAYGAIAFICMALPKDRRRSSKLHFARNNNPINMVFDKNMIMLSSEGEGVETTRDTLYSYNYRSGDLATKKLEVPVWKPWEGSNLQSSSAYTSQRRTTLLDSFGKDDYRYTTAPASWVYRPGDPKANDHGMVRVVTEDKTDFDFEASELEFEADEIRNSGFQRLDSSLSNLDTSLATGKAWLKADQQKLKFARVEEFLILPEDEDYSYEAVMGEEIKELVFENNLGQLLNIKSVIGDRVDQYLEGADGKYMGAVDLITYDIDSYRAMMIEDTDSGAEQDDDTVLEIDLLVAARVALATSPFWVSPWSVDPNWDWVADSVDDFMAQQAQRKLLTV